MTCLRPEACMKVPSKDSKRKTSLCRSCSQRKRAAEHPRDEQMVRARAVLAQRKQIEAEMEWCPVEYRHVYEELTFLKHGRAESKRLTLEHIAVMERRKARAA